MKRLLIILLSLSCVVAYTQKADSLFNVLDTCPPQTKASVYNQLVEVFIKTDKEKALEYAKLAIDEATKQKNKTELNLGYKNLGAVYYRLSKYPEAKDNYLKSLELSKELGDSSNIASMLLNTGTVNILEGNLDTAIQYYNKATFYYRETGDSLGISKIYNNSAYIYNLQGDNEHALQSYMKALKVKEFFNDSVDIAKTLNNIGIVYRETGNYQEALNYYSRALEIRKKLNDKPGLAQIYNSLGVLYMEWKDYTEALDFYNRSLELYKELNNKHKIGDILNNIGLIWKYTGDYDKALDYFRQSLKIRKEIGAKSEIATSLNNLGITYNAIGQHQRAIYFYKKSLGIKQELGIDQGIAISLYTIGEAYMNLHDNQKALKYFEECLPVAEKIELNQKLLHVYENLAIVHYALNQQEKYSIYQEKYKALRDSLFAKEKHEQFADFRVQYETREKEQQIEILKQANEIERLKSSRNLIAAIVVSFIAVLLLMLGLLWFRKNKLKNLHKTIELEQRLLRSQMNPHFIFNSLSAIQNYVFSNDPLKAGSYLSDFATLMRQILENSRTEFIGLDKEISTLEIYLKLQQLRFENKFEYTIRADENINPEDTSVPPMLAQPFIENALEHGLKNLDKKGTINIHFSIRGNNLTFNVKDNGIGREKAAEQSKRKNHKSLATIITNERLQMLSAKYNSHYTMHITDLPNNKGTEVVFNIPFQ